jgi:hypothetical protein
MALLLLLFLLATLGPSKCRRCGAMTAVRTSATAAIQVDASSTSYPCHEHSNHHTEAHMDKDAIRPDSFRNR